MFRNQAERFALLGSPVYARLAAQLAEDPAPLAPILRGDTSLDVLALFGAVHYHVITGVAPNALSGDWDDFATALIEHEDSLRRFVEEELIQTNETQRCVALVPAFLTLARETGLPLDLVELGPSAGLNLVFDRYGYRYAEGSFGDPRAPLSFDANERGHVPADLLLTPLTIEGRRGIDLSPIDVENQRDVILLRSFLWPGRSERATRLDAAIATYRATPQRPELIRGDYVDVLPGILRDRSPNALTVVFQTASTGYLEQEGYDSLRASLEAAAADGRPLAWVSSRRAEEKRIPGGRVLGARATPLAGAGEARRPGRLPRQLGRLGRRRMITSKDNPRLKLVRALQRKKEREETGLFACEGEDLCDAALAAGIEPVDLLIAGENVEAELLASVSTLPHPSRAIGVFRRADLPVGERSTCLALWRLGDPGNVGTLMRSADAFGAAVALSDGCAEPLSQKALRASAGAVFRVPLVPWNERPGRLVALDTTGVSLADADLSPPVTIVLGAERAGLPDEILAGCDVIAAIPMPGDAESLNVAAAGAIALYELSRRTG